LLEADIEYAKRVSWNFLGGGREGGGGDHHDDGHGAVPSDEVVRVARLCMP
jgi:hypothetical protein